MIDAKTLELLATQMADPETQWSLGTFGALAEFSRDPGEPVTLTRSERALSAVTGRGGIRVGPHPATRLVASETTTRASWNHRIALCLPAEQCVLNQRAVVSELGPDADALREEDRDAVLFDLGLAAVQTDLCVRPRDPRLVKQLRTGCGRSLFDPGNPAMALILEASPHRVFMSRLGRIEVYQPIPAADAKSPNGPHTHVLPRLLQHKRTHAATEPIPDGWIPCAHLYPAHPARDAVGDPRPFDVGRHEAFQDILHKFGDPQSGRAQAARSRGSHGRRGTVCRGRRQSVRSHDHSGRTAPTVRVASILSDACGLARRA